MGGLSKVEMAEKLNLNWVEFSQHLTLMFKDLYQEGKYSDVTLVSDDQTQFKAHKFVLSACSPVFKKIINNNPIQNPLIYLRGIQRYEVESILQFIYFGEAMLYQVRVGEFIKVAKDLEIKDVSQEGEILPLNDVDVPETDIPVDESVVVDLVLESKESDPLLSRGESKAHRCEACGARFRKISEVLRHSRAQHQTGDARKMEEIEIESKNISIKAETPTDIKSKLEGIKYPCSQCDYQGSRKEKLQRHIQTKHEGVKYSCNKCDFQFATQRSLQRHIETKHEGIKYPCDQCEYQGTQMVHLRTHIESNHTRIVFNCELCNFQTRARRLYNCHMKTHNEDYKFSCDKCDYLAKTNFNLQVHVDAKHGEKIM